MPEEGRWDLIRRLMSLYQYCLQNVMSEVNLIDSKKKNNFLLPSK